MSLAASRRCERSCIVERVIDADSAVDAKYEGLRVMAGWVVRRSSTSCLSVVHVVRFRSGPPPGIEVFTVGAAGLFGAGSGTAGR